MFPRNYGNCCPIINMLVPENLTIQPDFGMVTHEFHGLNAATLHSAADLLISD